MAISSDIGRLGAVSQTRADTASVTWIGTATVLLEVYGFTLLTDPNFLHRGEHAKLGYGLRSQRLTEPSCSIVELPPLDAVVLSHLHGDHFDDVAARELDRSLPIVTTRQGRAGLMRKGFPNAVGLSVGDEVVASRGGRRLVITAVPARHGPRGVHRLLPSVMGSMIDVYDRERRLLRVYVTGDTIPFDGLYEIKARFSDIDLALVHLGGTRIGGLLLTLDGRQGSDLLRLLRPSAAVPIHYGDYPVFRDPIENFLEQAAASGLDGMVTMLGRGETLQVARG